MSWLWESLREDVCSSRNLTGAPHEISSVAERHQWYAEAFHGETALLRLAEVFLTQLGTVAVGECLQLSMMFQAQAIADKRLLTSLSATAANRVGVDK